MPMNKKSQRFFGKRVSNAIIAYSLFFSIVSIFYCFSTTSSLKYIGLSNLATNAGTIQATNANTLVDVATDNYLKTFVKALKAAELEKMLSGKDEFTVFAPTDNAFASLPKGTLEKLLKSEDKTELKKILKYHIISGKFDSKTLKSGSFPTIEGSSVNIKVNRSSITVNDAKKIGKDIKANNGVIYLMNKVNIPPGLKL